MECEGWIMVLTPVVCIVISFIVLAYSRTGKEDEGLTGFLRCCYPLQ
jgi:hypothetical protein